MIDLLQILVNWTVPAYSFVSLLQPAFLFIQISIISVSSLHEHVFGQCSNVLPEIDFVEILQTLGEEVVYMSMSL